LVNDACVDKDNILIEFYLQRFLTNIRNLGCRVAKRLKVICKS
jgi:hypothetical protein